MKSANSEDNVRPKFSLNSITVSTCRVWFGSRSPYVSTQRSATIILTETTFPSPAGSRILKTERLSVVICDFTPSSVCLQSQIGPAHNFLLKRAVMKRKRDPYTMFLPFDEQTS